MEELGERTDRNFRWSYCRPGSVPLPPPRTETLLLHQCARGRIIQGGAEAAQLEKLHRDLRIGARPPLGAGDLQEDPPSPLPLLAVGGRDGATDVGLVHCGTSGPTWKLKGAISASVPGAKGDTVRTQYTLPFRCPGGLRRPGTSSTRALPASRSQAPAAAAATAAGFSLPPLIGQELRRLRQ